MVQSNLYHSDKALYYFYEISKIPRCSGDEGRISDYMVNFARERGLYVRQDELNNVVIKKPATKGYEGVPAVIIQGHLDMVCEKNAGTIHDFTQDPLKLVVEGDRLKAEGTTLGADNGIAVAYALALLDDHEIEHPELEVVMTTDEEVGLTGAMGMTVDDIKGKYFINLDSEEEGEFVISCAGGLRALIQLPLQYKPVSINSHQALQLRVKGLKGGHSGMEIDKNRVNANLLMGRILLELGESIPFDLAEIKGGMKDNVIPRESEAIIWVAREQVEHLQKRLEDIVMILKAENAGNDPGLTVLSESIQISGSAEAMIDEAKENCIFLLNTVPNGVQTMSADIPGLVESSLNLGRLYIENRRELMFEFATRSSVRSKRPYMVKRLQLLAKKCGAICTKMTEYPEWPIKKDSFILQRSIETYEGLYGKKPLVKGIHAGLEAGVFLEKLPELEAISFGPDIYDVHSPDEWVSLSSMKRTWDFLVTLLKNMK